jgi:beta-lactam-binding protein with PASTA domain
LIVVLVAIAAAVIAAGVGWQLHASENTAPVTLPLPISKRVVEPNVVGMSPWDAQALLARWGLAASVSDGDTSSAGAHVVAQEPGAGERVRVGSIIGLRTKPARHP